LKSEALADLEKQLILGLKCKKWTVFKSIFASVHFVTPWALYSGKKFFGSCELKSGPIFDFSTDYECCDI